MLQAASLRLAGNVAALEQRTAVRRARSESRLGLPEQLMSELR